MTSFQQDCYFELVNDSLMARTMEGIIRFWNSSAEKLYGWRKEEAIGQVSHNLLQTQFPKPLEEIESELVRNGVWQGRLVHTTRDGRRIVVESRWTLDLKEQSRRVFEINTPYTDREIDPQRPTERDSPETVRQEPVSGSKSVQAEDLLRRFANVVLAGGAGFFMFASFYFVYSHGWTADRDSITPFGMVLYWVFPALSAGLLFASIKLHVKHKIRIALLLCSTGFSLYSLETWFSLPDPDPEIKARVKVAKQLGVDFDSRTMEQVITGLRANGVDAYPVVASSWLMQRDPNLRSKAANDLWPLGSISDKVSVFCNEGGAYTIYKSDEHGFHNPKGIWKSIKLEIAAVGDSYTQGMCVGSEKNFVGLIRQQYPLTLNLGIAGNGPLTNLATIAEYLPSLRPRAVLWFYHEGTDPNDLKREKNHLLLMRYLEGTFTQGLLARQIEIDRVLAAYVDGEMNKSTLVRTVEEMVQEVNNQGLLWKIETFLKLQNLRQRLGWYGWFPAENAERLEAGEFWEVKDLFRQVLLRAKGTVDEWGGTLYFVYLPDWQANWEETRKDREAVVSVVSQLGIPIIDVHGAFQRHNDPLSLFPFRMPGHFNVEGHRVVAEEILRSIQSTESASPSH